MHAGRGNGAPPFMARQRIAQGGARHAAGSVRDPGPKHGQELRQPCRMRGPGRRRHQVAVGVGLVDADLGVGAAGQAHFRRAGGIGRARAAFQDARGRQQLGAMADGGDRLSGLVESAHDLQHLFVQAQVFRRASARDHQAVVGIGLDAVEVIVQGEIVAALFAVGLRALEVVDGGGDALAGLLAGANRVHRVAHRQQRLERHHGFVVFGVVADQHQQSLAHVCLLGMGDRRLVRPRAGRPVLDVLGPLCPRRRTRGW